MLVSLSPQTDKKGERMNSVMCHRQGGGLQEMISRTDPLITHDVSTGITEADGKVTLRYVVTLE